MPTTYHLFSAVWNPKLATSQGLSLEDKKNKFRAAADRAYSFMKQASANISLTNRVFVFAAPEYYWTRGFSVRASTKTEKESIYSTLQNISATNKKMVIFPGTVCWKIPKSEYRGAVTDTIRARPFVANNVCPVYHGGELKLEHYKLFNDGMVDKGGYKKEEEGTEEAFGADPFGSSHTVKINELKFGVEICGDNNAGRLASSLNGKQLDVMVLVASTMGHDFTTEQMRRIPVRDGGALVHSDGTGKESDRSQKNGLWVVQRGTGWHGSARNESTLCFEDLDRIRRTVGFSMKLPSSITKTLKISAISGFNPPTDLDATVSETDSTQPKKFSFVIPGKKPQTVVIELPKNPYENQSKVKLSRSMSLFGATRMVKLHGVDMAGMLASGTGNASRIGPIPGADHTDLACYYTPIYK